MTSGVQALFETARRAHEAGRDGEAKAGYLAVLAADQTHLGALVNLGVLALAGGHRTAAATAWRQAAACHSRAPKPRINLANLLIEDGEAEEALGLLDAVLAADPEQFEAHQAKARALAAQGRHDEAEPHWRAGFAGHALTVRPCRGSDHPLRILQLVSAKGGNTPTNHWFDDHEVELASLYADYAPLGIALPEHHLIVNAIGDADLNRVALENARALLAGRKVRCLNPPDKVLATGRLAIFDRLSGLPGLIVPRAALLPARGLDEAALARHGLDFPVLLRSPGYHTGRHFIRIDSPADLSGAAELPGDSLLAIQPLNARGDDGMFRKYRAILIEGKILPLHLAISKDWKVHYFTAAMAESPALRTEEAAYLADMETVIGSKAMTALKSIGERLGLDYAGVDFGLDKDGSLLLFEANAAMLAAMPDADPIWDYRRPAAAAILDAVRRMLRAG